jgi:hypothetical protein
MKVPLTWKEHHFCIHHFRKTKDNCLWQSKYIKPNLVVMLLDSCHLDNTKFPKCKFGEVNCQHIKGGGSGYKDNSKANNIGCPKKVPIKWLF